MVVTRTYLCPLRGNHSNPNHICKRLRHKTLKLLKYSLYEIRYTNRSILLILYMVKTAHIQMSYKAPALFSVREAVWIQLWKSQAWGRSCMQRSYTWRTSLASSPWPCGEVKSLQGRLGSPLVWWKRKICIRLWNGHYLSSSNWTYLTEIEPLQRTERQHHRPPAQEP